MKTEEIKVTQPEILGLVQPKNSDENVLQGSCHC